ncbi:MAG: efflux RND transporter periplasmic adaptor subunit [Hyphomonas sp.]|nr:efflux RND transporter periplasmic adaptor subunit [Hyphomonas sp.]
MKIRQILPFAALVLGTASCSAPPETPVPEPVATVTVIAAARGDLAVIVSGYGTIAFDPVRQRVLTTETEARVATVLAQAGQNVQSGAPLLRLSLSSASNLDLTRTRQDAATAQSEYERQQRLRADGLASEADVERARAIAQDLAAQARVLSQNAGAIREIASPIDAVVDSVFVAPGDVVSPGAQLIRLSAPDAIQAQINMEVEDAMRLSAGDHIQIKSLDSDNHAIETEITSVDVRIDPQTRMASVIAAIPAGNGFLSGEAVRAEAVAEIHENVILVPRNAVFNDEVGEYVFVEQQDAAQLRRVEVGETSGDRTEIKSGLADGERVVTSGGAVLSDGMKLNVAGSTQAPSGVEP